MEDFRNKLKLDHIDADFEDWDNEDAWIEIEQRLPKKRKRKFWLWLVGLVLLVASAFVLNSIVKPLNNRAFENDIFLKEKKDIEPLNIINKKSNLSSITSNSNLYPSTEIQTSNSVIDKFQSKRAPSRSLKYNTLNSSGKQNFYNQNKEIKEKNTPLLLSKNSNVLGEEKVARGLSNSHSLDPLPLFLHYSLVLPKVINNDYKLTEPVRTTRGKWAITLQGGRGFFNKKLTPIVQDIQELVLLRTMIESPEELFYFKIQIERQITQWGLAVYSGVSYSQYNERLFHQYSSETERLIFSSQGNYIDQGNGTRFYIPGFINEISTTTGEINKYNETRFVELPFGFIYQKNVGRFTLGAHFGTSVSFYNQSSGDIVLLDNKLIAKEAVGHINANPFKVNSYKLGIRTNIKFNNTFGVSASVDYLRNKIKIDGIYGVEEKLQGINFGLGATAYLK